MLLSFERPVIGGIPAGALSATLENCTAATCSSPFQRGLERSCAPSSSMSQGAHGYHRGQCLAACPHRIISIRCDIQLSAASPLRVSLAKLATAIGRRQIVAITIIRSSHARGQSALKWFVKIVRAHGGCLGT